MEKVKEHRFEDGSVVRATLDGGTVSCGTGSCNYSGVRVSRNSGVTYAYFDANYSITNGMPGKVTATYNWYTFVLGGTSASESLSIPIPTEGVNYAAQATLGFTVSRPTGSFRAWLSLYVGNDTAWHDANY